MTPSPTEYKLKGTQRMAYLALLVSLGIVLSLVENALPPLLPLPGAKLGLANIATVTALYIFGPRMAIEVTVIRCLLGGLLRGSLFGLALGLTAGIASTVVMCLLFVFLSDVFSILGVSVAGAVTHNVTQLGVAVLLFIRHPALLQYYLPYLVILAIPTGLFVGLASLRINNSLKSLRLSAG